MCFRCSFIFFEQCIYPVILMRKVEKRSEQNGDLRFRKLKCIYHLKTASLL